MPSAARAPDAVAHLLGAHGFTTIVSRCGSGASRWNGLAVTRWHAGERDGGQGGFVYLRDLAGAAPWSAAPSPCGGSVRGWFDGSCARFARRDGAIVTTLEVAVDPEAPVEVRGIGLRNEGPVPRQIELTSYAELALNAARADDAHPAYSKMFVQTALEDGILLAWRRKKDAGEPDIWAAHALVVDGEEAGARECETDRVRFIGRDGSLCMPAAMRGSLSGTTGTVLDPIFSLRGVVAVPAGATRRVACVTAVGESREEVLARIRAAATPEACTAIFRRARAAARADASIPGQQLAAAILGSDGAWRADSAIVARAEGGAPVLWAEGISGDLPIVLLHIADAAQLGVADELMALQRWWRARQLPVDIVMLNGAAAAAGEALDRQLRARVPATGTAEKAQGSVFVLRAPGLDPGFLAGLHAAACIVIEAREGSLATQAARRGGHPGTFVMEFPSPRPARASGGKPGTLPAPAQLAFWNGRGGFSADGREYVTVLEEDASTPMPWSHLIANRNFGFMVTATGGGYCWAVNSQQNQLTRWSNDPVRDPAGQAFLLRDADDGIEWSATAAPIRAGGASYVARFGPGYARFDANVHGIESELLQCVAPDAPVQLSRLRVANRTARARRIDIAQVVDWQLGPIGGDPRPTTQVELDPRRAAVFARNAWREEFGGCVAFMACGEARARPCTEAGPRSAVVATLDLGVDETADIVFLLGEAADRRAAESCLARWRKVDFDRVLDGVRGLWDGVLGGLQVDTPQRSLDLLVNRCLPYQVLACRLWARTAFYQASGAFGFRDQLQDVGALCIARPDLVREHLLLSASRQFEEGDVQHWWLPPSGRGVRTRIVDDRLWLPYIVAHYVATTGDAGILDERVPFLHGDALAPAQTDSFFAPAQSTQSGSLFEHCARAIDASLATGAHGLPLMGTGDWNDGMNRVGAGGKGESVWMAWFLIRVITDFAPSAESRDPARATRWRDHARALELAAETKAWDGAWYRRAFYDDGTPLGTAADRECRIESMAQSWAVISGRADPDRAARAMRALNEQLVRPHDGLVALFTEPFDATAHDPGYIKGYPPGLRENGGQYTHGSLWSMIAFAIMGDGDKVGELLEIFDPIRKADTPQKLARYKVEPYVECADVYSVDPHTGRGGWTWYSGSAGWLYRAIVEWVLGFRLQGDRLHVQPCIPSAWQGYSMTYRRGSTSWRIEVANPGRACGGVAGIEMDGVTLADCGAGIPLREDGATHHVRVTLEKEPR